MLHGVKPIFLHASVVMIFGYAKIHRITTKQAQFFRNVGSKYKTVTNVYRNIN